MTIACGSPSLGSIVGSLQPWLHLFSSFLHPSQAYLCLLAVSLFRSFPGVPGRSACPPFYLFYPAWLGAIPVRPAVGVFRCCFSCRRRVLDSVRERFKASGKSVRSMVTSKRVRTFWVEWLSSQIWIKNKDYKSYGVKHINIPKSIQQKEGFNIQHTERNSYKS